MSTPPERTVVNFYSTTGEYGCFSNFSRHAIHLKGKRWPTSEHYFQAQKFAGGRHDGSFFIFALLDRANPALMPFGLNYRQKATEDP